MKKCIATLAIVLASVFCVQSFTAATPAAAADIPIIIDGQRVSSDVSPTIINGRTMVPVRVIGEWLGASVNWDNSTRTATISKGGTTLSLGAGQYSYTLNGTSYSLDVPVTIQNGRTLAPLRVISESLGAGVLWAENTVYIGSTGSIIICVDDVDGSIVNLRSGPGTSYEIVGRVSSGQYLEVVGVSNGWYEIKTSNGTAYITGQYTTLYNGSGTTVNPSEPTPGTDDDPATTPSTGEANGTLSVSSRSSGTGQSSIAFNIGEGSVDVVSNDGETVVMEIDGAQLSSTNWQPSTYSPFTALRLENDGSDAVRITATVTSGGYFRLDIDGSTFTVTAVAKHKNGTTGLAGKTIVVSAGHGIYSTGGVIDRGAVSTIDPSFDEVDFNTYVAQILRNKLEAAGATVIMIREDENPIDMTLYERSVVANSNNADAFIEIHGDSAGSSASGIGTWAYTGSTRLTSAAQEDMRNEFAYVMNQAMTNATGEPAYVKYENFSVLRETEVPCVLIECGFLSNAHDLALLKDPAYWEKLATGMYNGLYNFFSY